MSRKPLVIANTARSNLMPPKIIFKKDFEPEKIANNLNSIFSLPEFLEKFESESGIEYIDLRFDGKVFYK